VPGPASAGRAANGHLDDKGGLVNGSTALVDMDLMPATYAKAMFGETIRSRYAVNLALNHLPVGCQHGKRARQ